MTNDEEPNNYESIKQRREQDRSAMLTLSTAPKLQCETVVYYEEKNHEDNI